MMTASTGVGAASAAGGFSDMVSLVPQVLRQTGPQIVAEAWPAAAPIRPPSNQIRSAGYLCTGLKPLRTAIMHAKASSIPDAIESDRESTRPIRALNRGLEVLTELNRLERAPINTLASAVR